MSELYNRISDLCQNHGISVGKMCNQLGISRGNLTELKKERIKTLRTENLTKIAGYFDVSVDYLLGKQKSPLFPEPEITEDYVTFPVIGEVAAGYEHIIQEDWSGDTIDIPVKYLRGRPQSDYIVLTVTGNSMYPLYLDGDKVLVLKQSTLDRSGDIGLIRYDGECATLKKVEYVTGEDWMKLIPLNPEYQPRTIEGADLEQCEVIGVPRLLIREIEQ